MRKFAPGLSLDSIEQRAIGNADFGLGALRLRRTLTPTPLPMGEGLKGFSLIELLVALAVFAALAAAAYGGLSGIARTRGALAERQDRLAAIVRAVSTFERDLRQAVSRPVRGNARGEIVPALAGTADRIELTRLGFANPRAEPRSNLERVVYATDARKLVRGRYAALDRAPNSVPAATVLLDDVDALRLRYLGADGAWRDTWPPQSDDAQTAELLPRVIEFRIGTGDTGELRRVIELPSAIPTSETNAAPGGRTAPPPGTRQP
jgi:general secretion pathway protein J